MNLTPSEIMDGMARKNLMLSQKNDEYLELSEKRAQAERIYNVALAACVINLKQEGFSITLINTMAKGDKHVAECKYKYDVAYGVERACLEAIKNLRGAVDTYRSLLAWLKAEMTAQ